MSSSSPSEASELARLLIERERRARHRKLWTYYPDTGPLRRELYPRHMAFFRAGARHQERLMLAANRIGKTEGIGGYEVTLHLTGLYPDWWEGRRFRRPTRWWAAGATKETTRDIVQAKLLGPWGDFGTGLIPGECLGKWRPQRGIAEAVDTLNVRHASGGYSRLGFKAYEQGRKSFEGTEKDGIWFDEEPPLDVYGEAVMRTASTVPGEEGGLVICTFTPLQGMSQTVLYFLPEGIDELEEQGA